jgi:hypothetical protein
VVAKALFDTYTHFKEDGAPAALKPKLFAPEEMARLLKAADYQRWSETYLNQPEWRSVCRWEGAARDTTSLQGACQ